MNQYLLLRDNKQTGPYTAAELAAKGLKAYDLVWLEGKSAAWRYPSELAELKPFAPVVEEQPYDRFYKKTQEESHPALERAQKAALMETKKEKEKVETPPVKKEESPVYEKPEAPVVNPKKIYVTLPATASNASQKKTFSENINKVTEERPVVKKQEATPVIIFEEEPIADLATQLQENERSRPARRRVNSQPYMMRGLAAACILLFGVIIGLFISNMKQSSQNQSLEDMVKRIQERDQQRNSAPVLTPQTVPVQQAQKQEVDSSNVVNKEQEDPTEKLRISTVARKGNTPPDGKQQVVNTESQKDIASNTVEEKLTYQQGAIESARKNIHQMLLVENSKFKTGVLGGISGLHMTLSNNSRFPLDQVEIEIKYFGPEQKLVKTQTLLFNDMAPGEQKTLEAPKTSRGITIDYNITRIQSKVLGLAQHKL